MAEKSMIQILELFGGIGSPRCALKSEKNMNDYVLRKSNQKQRMNKYGRF